MDDESPVAVNAADAELCRWAFWRPTDQLGDRRDVLAEAPEDLDTALRVVGDADLSPEREHMRNDLLAFCAEHRDALHRSCLSGHLTGSGFVVDPVTETVLLIHHRKLDRWLQPGGHADGEGNLARVAVTEVQEETGLSDMTLLLPAFDVDIHLIPARPGEPEHVHLDLRFAVVVSGDETLQPADGEVFDAKWFLESAPELADNGDVGIGATRALQIARQWADGQ